MARVFANSLDVGGPLPPKINLNPKRRGPENKPVLPIIVESDDSQRGNQIIEISLDLSKTPSKNAHDTKEGVNVKVEDKQSPESITQYINTKLNHTEQNFVHIKQNQGEENSYQLSVRQKLRDKADSNTKAEFDLDFSEADPNSRASHLEDRVLDYNSFFVDTEKKALKIKANLSNNGEFYKLLAWIGKIVNFDVLTHDNENSTKLSSLVMYIAERIQDSEALDASNQIHDENDEAHKWVQAIFETSRKVPGLFDQINGFFDNLAGLKKRDIKGLLRSAYTKILDRIFNLVKDYFPQEDPSSAKDLLTLVNPKPSS